MDCIKKAENINLLWASVIIEELTRHGITYFCLSPGSRSTPLTIAAARHPKVISKIMYDERGAAFHALGYARATKKAAVLICTSGTAVANYYPAIVEAYQENIPVIVLSADRPPELRGRGANQTIDQTDIFGKYCRYFKDMPCPAADHKAAYVLNEINRIIEKSHLPDAGPVQLNCMFREPLAAQKESWPDTYLDDISDWLKSQKPYKEYRFQGVQDKNQYSDVIGKLNQNKTGIILAGRMEDQADQKAVIRLSEKTGWPVFADITSGIRLNKSASNVITYYDQLLLSGKIKNILKNRMILHFGGQLVSKRLFQFLEEHQGEHVHIMAENKIIDPAHSVTMRIQNRISLFIDTILPKIEKKTSAFKELFEYNQVVSDCIDAFSASQRKINEISAAVIVSRDIPAETALFIASSMPIRDMDMFAVAGDNNVIVGANRGASGIDGTIASAFGFANGLKRPLILLIGDLAFLHDLNSLTMLKECEQPVLIILINNQGGGIFSFLPVARFSDVFERNFGTPHDYGFDKAAEMFSLKYFKPRTNVDFEQLYSQYQYSSKATLIEITTDRTENVELHKKLQQQIRLLLP